MDFEEFRRRVVGKKFTGYTRGGRQQGKSFENKARERIDEELRRVNPKAHAKGDREKPGFVWDNEWGNVGQAAYDALRCDTEDRIRSAFGMGFGGAFHEYGASHTHEDRPTMKSLNDTIRPEAGPSTEPVVTVMTNLRTGVPIIHAYYFNAFGTREVLLNEKGEPDDLADSLPDIQSLRRAADYDQVARELCARVLKMLLFGKRPH